VLGAMAPASPPGSVSGSGKLCPWDGGATQACFVAVSSMCEAVFGLLGGSTTGAMAFAWLRGGLSLRLCWSCLRPQWPHTLVGVAVAVHSEHPRFYGICCLVGLFAVGTYGNVLTWASIAMG
jgi:hypothetical protein